MQLILKLPICSNRYSETAAGSVAAENADCGPVAESADAGGCAPTPNDVLLGGVVTDRGGSAVRIVSGVRRKVPPWPGMSALRCA